MTAPAAPPRRSGGRAGRWHWLDWMVVPSLVILAVVVGYPIVRAVLLSFQRYKVLTGLPAQPVGLGNYQQLAHDPVFWQSLRNTVVYTGVSVGVAVVIGLVLALLTENLGGPWRFIRTVLLTPWAVPMVVVAFLFRYIFDQDSGVANGILRGLGLIDSNVHWLTSSAWAMPALIVTNAWTATPFFYLIFTAALTSVPTEVVESARVDRASLASMVFRIKLPYLRGPALVAVLIMVVNSFNDFTKIWSMTEGGPGYSTSTLVIYVYRLAFSSFDMGYAAAAGVVWLVLLIVFAVFYIRLLQRRAS